MTASTQLHLQVSEHAEQAPISARGKRNAERSKRLEITRRCHDCGRPTPNYRCSGCLRKWRAKHDVSDADIINFDGDSYSAGVSYA